MSDPTTLPRTLSFVCKALGDGIDDRHAPCRQAVLATVGDGGAARMVILRAFTPWTVEVHSDLAAAKVAQLRAEPRATLLFWLPEAQMQIRLRARFTVLAGTEVADRWTAIPDGPRRAYGGTPPPGTPLLTPDDHTSTPNRDRFAVLSGIIDSIETLHLGDIHRRAIFRRDDGFIGGWIAP